MSRIDRLEDRIAELEDVLGMTAQIPVEILPRGMFPNGQRFSWPKVQQVAGILLRREYGDRNAIFDAIYGGRPESQTPEIKIIDIFVCHVRKALRDHGIKITTIYGQGWYIDAENKAKLRTLISGFSQASAA